MKLDFIRTLVQECISWKKNDIYMMSFVCRIYVKYDRINKIIKVNYSKIY